MDSQRIKTWKTKAQYQRVPPLPTFNTVWFALYVWTNMLGLVLHKLCSLQAQTFRVPKKRTNNNANKYCWLSKNYTRYEFKFCGHVCTSVHMYYKEMHFAMCLILSFSTLPISFKCLFFVPGDSEFLAKRSWRNKFQSIVLVSVD